MFTILAIFLKYFLLFLDMLKIISKYNEIFKIEKSKGLMKLFNGFMLTLPHIITCLILIIFFPEKWIEIFIVGLLIPDLSYFFYMFVHPAAMLKGDYHLYRIGKYRKKVAHILTFIVILFLLLTKQYVLVLAGGIHLFLDLLGF